MITAIKNAQSILDHNSALRDLFNQLRKNTIAIPDFVHAYDQLFDSAKECDLRFFGVFNTFAPIFYTPDQLFVLQTDVADLMEKEELQRVADLLRSGKLDITPYQWELKWHFLLSRGVDLGIFWDTERKRFK